jgi:hypothetical protein
MLLGNFAHHSLGDLRVFPEACEMSLPNLLAPAHVVHQIELVPFAANKRHDFASSIQLARSVHIFHYTL